MAESESTTTQTTWEDLVILLFGLLLVSNALQQLPGVVREKTGIELVASTSLRAIVLEAPAPQGTLVRARESTDLRDAPHGTRVVGSLAAGDPATIEEGPEQAGGVAWWKVRADTGTPPPTGWVAGDTLDRLIVVEEGGFRESIRALSELGPTTPLGTAVRVTRGADLFSRPGGGATLGYVAESAGAILRLGPEMTGPVRWWFIESASGQSGWIVEDALELDTPVKTGQRFISYVLIIGAVLSLLFLFGLAYITYRTNQIRATESRRIKAALPKKEEPVKNERWERIVAHVSSENPSDWRLAIIEADIMLDELVTRIGYRGPSLGEKLKLAARGDFTTLDAAWEAHKVRNRIAHAGSDYILTKREARRVIELYASVFNEFKYV